MGELAHSTVTWWQAHFGAVMLGSLQLSLNSSDKTKPGEMIGNSSQENDPVKVQSTPHRMSLSHHSTWLMSKLMLVSKGIA